MSFPFSAGRAYLPGRRELKWLAYRVAQEARIVPTIWIMRNPFKIHEYREVLAGAGLKRDHTVLDLGCGNGLQTQILARRRRRDVLFPLIPWSRRI